MENDYLKNWLITGGNKWKVLVRHNFKYWYLLLQKNDRFNSTQNNGLSFKFLVC